eukprot:5294056-Amphidinium_carterae.1
MSSLYWLAFKSVPYHRRIQLRATSFIPTFDLDCSAPTLFNQNPSDALFKLGQTGRFTQTLQPWHFRMMASFQQLRIQLSWFHVSFRSGAMLRGAIAVSM